MITFTRDGVRRGYIAAQPLAISVLVWGLSFGLLAFGAGLTIGDAALMSATVYSGSAQTAALGALSAGAGLIATVTTCVLLNSRYLLYGATLRPWLGNLPTTHAYGTLYVLGDSNWLLSMKAWEGGERDAGFVFGSGVAMFIPWVGGTVGGALIGDWIPSPSVLAIDFLLVGFCMAMLLGMLKTRSSVGPGIVALVVALVVDRIAPGWAIPSAGLSGAAVAWALHRDPVAT